MEDEVIIIDEKGECELRKYEENIGKQLIKENEIEFLENQKENLEQSIRNQESNKEIVKGELKNISLIYLVLIIVILLPGTFILKELFNRIVGILILPTYFPLISYVLFDYSKIKKDLHGIKNQYQMIEEELETKSKELEKSFPNHQITKLKPLNQKVMDKPELERIKHLLALSYELGIRKEKDKYITPQKIVNSYEPYLSKQDIKDCIDITLGLKKTKEQGEK